MPVDVNDIRVLRGFYSTGLVCLPLALLHPCTQSQEPVGRLRSRNRWSRVSTFAIQPSIAADVMTCRVRVAAGLAVA